MSDHRPGPSYRHPEPRQDCTCGAQFRGESMEEAVEKYRNHAWVASFPAKETGRAGVARARAALAEKMGGAA